MPTLTRRSAIRAAGIASGGALLAAALPVRAAARPAVVVVNLNFGSQPWPPPPALLELMNAALQPLLAENPGLQVKWTPSGIFGGAAQASMLAGGGPDIFADWVLDGYAISGLAYDLAPLVKRDNLNLNVYLQGQLRYIRQVGELAPVTPNALPALPEYMLPMLMAVNQGVLDQLGLKYPELNWTYADWTRLWETTTVKPQGSNQGRAGVWLNGGSDFFVGYDHSYNLPGAWVLAGFGGEFVDPNDQSRSDLGAAGSVAGGEWFYNLLQTGAGNGSQSGFFSGQTVTNGVDSQGMISLAEQMRGVKWDFYNLPVWPVTPTTYTSTDSLGMWAGTKNVEATWTVLKYLSYETQWQRLQMRALLFAPSRRDLMDEWVAVMRQVAPPLRSKNLQLFISQAEANQQYVGQVFRYNPGGVQTVLGKLSNAIGARTLTVAQGFAATAKQLDALESAGERASAATAAAAALYQRDTKLAAASPGTYNFPAPNRNGVGAPGVTVPRLVQHSGTTWTVTGGGSGISYEASNGLTFAGVTTTAANGVFSCRLTAIRAVKPNTINDGSKFGLMVRGDLSDIAPELGIEVAAGRGVHVHCQPVAGSLGGDFKSAGATAAGGLLLASQILLPDSTPAKNFLQVPVWLRLVRQDNKWTGYSSLDGKHWTQAGPTLEVELLGGWIGLYVTAHGNGNLVSATFDHLTGFTPNTFVQVGAP